MTKLVPSAESKGETEGCPRSRFWDLGSLKPIPTGNTHPPLCHPERSRGICSSADLSWKRWNSILKQNCHLACPGAPWDRSAA